MAGLLALKMGKIWSYRKHWSYTSIWWWWQWWWWWRWRWWCWLREEVLNAGRREKVWIFQGTSGDHMDCSRPPENGSRCAQCPARHCLPVPQIHSATWRNTSYELKKSTFHQLKECIFHIAPPERVAIAVYWAVAHFHCVRNRPTLLRANLWGQVLQILCKTLNKYFC